MNFELSDAQRAVITPALARDDRCIFPITAALKGGAVGNVAKSLIRRRLIEEVLADDLQTVWRCDDDGRPLTLRLSDAAVAALGDGVEQPGNCRHGIAEPDFVAQSTTRKRGTAVSALIELVRRADGATLSEMSEATGWQNHSVRGALSGVIAKKLGHTVRSVKDGDRGRVYRVADQD